jgi:hypothetical protein
MGASVVLNIIIEEGHIATFSNRIRRWVTPDRSNTRNEGINNLAGKEE